jgi:hypothetical protein
MSGPTVTLCVPAYEAGAFVAQTLRSALAQTHDAIRVVVSGRSVVRRYCCGLSQLRGWSSKWTNRARFVGVHNYSDVNRFRNRGLGGIIAEVQRHQRDPVFWLTETGGVVGSTGPDGDYWCDPTETDSEDPSSRPQRERIQVKALNWLFGQAETYERYIDRVYLYSWYGTDCATFSDSDGGIRNMFDAGLIRSAQNFSTRSGYGGVKRPWTRSSSGSQPGCATGRWPRRALAHGRYEAVAAGWPTISPTTCRSRRALDRALRTLAAACDPCLSRVSAGASSACSREARDAASKSGATTPHPHSFTTRAISPDGPTATASRAWMNSKSLLGSALA